MLSKADRHREILKIVGEGAVATQAELRSLLIRAGMKVDQATVSRDIRELGLVKVSDGGGSRYATVEEVAPPGPSNSAAVVGRFAREIETSRNIVVVKTDPGNAPPLGLALDRLRWPEVIGTVAGDDTLLVVVSEKTPARKVAKKLAGMKK